MRYYFIMMCKEADMSTSIVAVIWQKFLAREVGQLILVMKCTYIHIYGCGCVGNYRCKTA